MAGGPTGMIIMANQIAGSSGSTFVYLTRVQMMGMLSLHFNISMMAPDIARICGSLQRHEDEPGSDHVDRHRPRNIAIVLSFLHRAQAQAQLDADNDNLERDEELADIFKGAGEPSVKVASFLHAIEEETLKHWDEAEDGTNRGSDRSWRNE